jgi:hypothetical protein
MWQAIDKQLTHRRVLVAGWLLLVMFAHPGYMSYDSGAQLAQARGIDPTTNWHPPVMALIWRYCDRLIEGPFLMLAIQSIALLAGLYILMRRVLSDRSAAIAAVLILLSPPVLPPMATIWKDSQMAGFLMLAIAAMTSKKRGYQLAGCFLLFLGTAQRWNAAAATLPILIGLFVWRPDLVRWKRYAISVGAWLALTATAGLVNDLLAFRKENVFGSLEVLDIAGVIRYHRHFTDDEIRREAPGLPWNFKDNLQHQTDRVYRPTDTWLDLCDPGGIYRYPRFDEDVAAVNHAWKNLIVSHPLAYLHHRVEVFLAELRVTHRDNFYLWWGIDDSPETELRLGHKSTHSWLQETWFMSYWALRDTPVYWAWVYFVIGLVLVYLLRRDKVGLTIVTSGVLCEAGLFLVAPAVDYRYSHWMITCTVVAAVYYSCLVARRKRDKAVVGLAGEKPVLG